MGIYLIYNAKSSFKLKDCTNGKWRRMQWKNLNVNFANIPMILKKGIRKTALCREHPLKSFRKNGIVRLADKGRKVLAAEASAFT